MAISDSSEGHSQKAVSINPLLGVFAEDTQGNVDSVLAYLQWVRQCKSPSEPNEKVSHGEWLLLEACRRALATMSTQKHCGANASQGERNGS